MKLRKQRPDFVKLKGPKAVFCKWHLKKIAPLQDAVDLDEATDKEKASLLAWRKYRVQVNRVDTLKPVWPEKPASSL